jgi:uncharacterized protein (TIGR00661 family)
LKVIAYYISDYGYGHASRSIAVIRELLTESEVKVIVCHSYALSFLKESLLSKRVCFRELKTDIGYFLQKDSIHPDKVRLLQEYKAFIADWDHYIQREREFLLANNVDLVVSDISPLPFKAAASLDIPSVGISNFTWYMAYQGLMEENDLKIYKESYQFMDYFFSLAGSKEHWLEPFNHYGFFSRKVDLQEVKRIRQFVNPKGDLKVVFLGLGMKIDVGLLNELPVWNSPGCVFVVSSNVKVNLPNVYRIPDDYLETQNYIAASDLVISKAGWGMIGEAISANVPLLILDRPSMKEDQNTISYLKQHQLCGTIDWEAFMTYQVDQSQLNKWDSMTNEHSSKLCNQAQNIAMDLINIIKR